MGTLVSTLISVVVAIAISGIIFVGFNALIDATGDRWPVSVAGLGGFIGIIVGVIVQHNGWLKLGGDLGGPLQPGWLSILLGVVVGAAVGYGFGTVRTPPLPVRQRVENRWRPVAFVGPAVAFVILGLVLPSLKTIIISFRAGRRGEGEASLSNYEQIFSDDDFFNLTDFDRIFTSRLFIVALLGVIIAVFAAYASASQLGPESEARATRLGMRAIGIGAGVVAALVVIGLIEGIARTPNQSWIYDNILTPVVQSRVSLWILIAVFFGGGLAYLARSRQASLQAVPAGVTTGSADAATGPTDNMAISSADSGSSRSLIAGLHPGLVASLGAAAVISILLGVTGLVTTAEFTSLVLLVAGLALLAVVLVTNSRLGNLDLGAPTASLSLVVAGILLGLAVFSTLQSVLWNNLWWVATVTGLSTVLGLLLAILADRARGEIAARTLIFLPMAISMVGAAVIWDFVFELQASGTQTGLMNAILQGLGFKARGFFINSTLIPWNNFWIMLIMIWIQTGFAMVILSAAIKGVPDELVEAARVDGANEVQVFWRVIIPQIRTTIVVVVTTLIIGVMKVFDLVKATTGGANRTNVLANEMFNQLRDANFSLASAFAVVIFALVVPVMVLNVRRNLRELAG